MPRTIDLGKDFYCETGQLNHAHIVPRTYGIDPTPVKHSLPIKTCLRFIELLEAAPAVERVAIGRAAIARALLVGLDRSVRDLRALLA